MSFIPSISLKDENVVQQIQEACIEFGFFYLTDHGISNMLREQVYAQMKTFFELPTDVKMKSAVDTTFRGYTPLFEETLDPDTQSTGDTKEGFYIGRHVPEESEEALLPLHGPNQYPDATLVPLFKPTFDTYFMEMTHLAHTVAALIGEAAGASQVFAQEGTFDKLVDGRPMAALRLLHYTPTSSQVDKGILAAGAHTDYGMLSMDIIGLLTLLSTDEQGGLEIKYDGKWHRVPVRTDAFVINLGDMAERWTNGHFRSTLHRVVNVNGKDRYSIPFFYDPNFHCKVQALPSCTTAPLYEPTTSGEHLLEKYRQTHATFQG